MTDIVCTDMHNGKLVNWALATAIFSKILTCILACISSKDYNSKKRC